MIHSFEFPADTAVLGEIATAVGKAGLEAGFDEVEVGEIQLAADEACTNTIMHGLDRDPAKQFRLILDWQPEIITISILEYGKPFDPDAVKNHHVKGILDENKIGGLGLLLVYKMMDDVDYSMDETGLKTLRMIRRKKRDGE
jgi:serine/threonine-protein kinase RsbW